jgi:hypothetical protein
MEFFQPFWDLRPAQWLDRLATIGIGDQCGEAHLARFFLFRADDPEGCRPPVPRRLGLKELPGLAARPETALLFGGEARLVSLFVRILAGLMLCASERFETGGAHTPFAGEFLGFPDVHHAPLALWVAWREANGVGVVVDFPSDAINPAETEGFVDRLGIVDARFAGRLLVEANPKFLAMLVRPFEPTPKPSRSSEEDDFHRPDFS